jgi:hypothetical protein
MVIRADRKIGGFDVQRGNTLRDAVRVFGQPSVRRVVSLTCKARWNSIGLAIDFITGDVVPARCGPNNPFTAARVTGRGWRTNKGLRIGDPTHRIFELYGRPRRKGAWYALITRIPPPDPSAPCASRDRCRYTALAAKVHSGRVVAFRVDAAPVLLP